MSRLLLLTLALSASSLSATDLFPTKARVAFATRFSIHYKNTYKTIRFKHDDGDRLHILVPEGVVAPVLSEVAEDHGIMNHDMVSFIQVPVSEVAITNTFMAPFLEILGETSSLKATRGVDLTGRYRIASACVNKLAADGEINTTADIDAVNALDLGVVFTDVCPNWGGDCPDRGAIMAWDEETGIAAQSDYVQLVAAYFNKEKEGLELAAAVHNKLELAKSEMADMILTSTSDRPKVLWAYNYYGTWYPTLDHNNYKGELTAAAGGEMIGLGQLGSAATTNEYGGMGDDDFKELAAQADVIMYDSNFTEAKMNYMSVLEDLPAYQNKRIFDIYQKGNYWFERRIVMPNILLEDLAQAFYPETFPGGGFTFIRDVFAQPDVGVEGLFPAPATCTDVDAALALPEGTLFTETSGSGSDSSGSDSSVSAAHVSFYVVGALLVLILGLLLGWCGKAALEKKPGAGKAAQGAGAEKDVVSEADMAGTL